MGRRRYAYVLAALVLLAIGVAIGHRVPGSARPVEADASTVTVTAPADSGTRAPTVEAVEAPGMGGSRFTRTPSGAATAAAAYLSVLSGRVVAEPAAVKRTLTRIVSARTAKSLVDRYRRAARRARLQLGPEAASHGRLVQSASVGFRIDGFQPDAATVSVWRVGIVGSGSYTRRQSWRTETVSLVWEGGTWKIDAVRSSPGPVPVPAGTAASRDPVLGAVVDTFEEFTRAIP